jgi:hypothetical protein
VRARKEGKQAEWQEGMRGIRAIRRQRMKKNEGEQGKRRDRKNERKEWEGSELLGDREWKRMKESKERGGTGRMKGRDERNQSD